MDHPYHTEKLRHWREALLPMREIACCRKRREGAKSVKFFETEIASCPV